MSDLFAGPGEMRARCRALDWAATPLGPPERWPAALRTTVRLALESPFPVNLWCGPERVLIYNDAYVRALGDKHPGSLGRRGAEVWAEVWNDVAPMFARIDRSGEPTFAEDARFVMRRGHGVDGGQDAWFTFGLSAVRDEDGRVVAYFNPAVETTGRVMAERREHAMREAAEHAERRLREVFRQAPSFFVVLRGPAHVIEFANDAYHQLVGRGPEILGRPVAEALPEVRGQGLVERLDQVLATGEPFRGRGLSVRLARAPGAAAEERFVDFVYQAYVEPDGTRSGVIAHGTDITDAVRARREVEQLLAASEVTRRALAEANVQLQDQQLELELGNQQLQEQAAGLEAANAELQRAGAALDAERALLERVVAQLPAAVAVFEGPEMRFRAVSTQYAAIVGGRPVLGRPIREALPELAGDQDFFALLDRVYATGEPAVGTDVPSRWDGDGDGVPEEHVIDFVYAPLHGPARADGNDRGVTGVIAFVLDVGGRAAAQAALRESEARFRNVADAAPVMLWVTERDGTCTFLNRQWLQFTGQTLEEGLGLGWLTAVHPDDAAEAERVFLDATARAAPFRLDYRLRRADGQYRWAVDAADPRLGPDGEFLGYIGSVVDIQERTEMLEAERAARAEAERASRAKSEFLAVMSHELRTPLNAIGGYAELLQMGIRGPVTPAQAEDLDRIRASQQHLLGLINEVLNYARVETGTVHYDLADVPLAEVVASVEPLVAPQLAAKRHTFARAGCTDPGVVARADREKVRQVLLNLLSNAVKFTPAGGHVTVRCAPAGPGRVAVQVSDTGVGIPPDHLERVFEPFVQVNASLTRTHEGTGLGLAISRDLARGMGGDLAAESRPGEGSTFTLTLPAA